MKFRVTMKDPDTLHDAIEEAVHDTLDHEDHWCFDFIPSIDNEGDRPGYRWGYFYRASAGCKLFGYMATEPWLMSERRPTGRG